ncbi:hypothetical protein [Shewanella algidipiscicola]|uniref:hypothetical protein n=1 Tax=Shewanella algidipiscicola TaxID=614070 RepID=UPI000D78A186|nr:hypothetical protein [Shewanella algidipiscicola]
MKKLIYQGYLLTNNDGLTDSWTLSIGEQRRSGSLFELRRQIHFYQELGVLPPVNAPTANTERNTQPSSPKVNTRQTGTRRPNKRS